MITISRHAHKYIIQLLSKQKEGTNIRIFIDFPGTNYAECGLAYCDIHDIDVVHDKKFFFDDFYIYVNKSIVPFLKNTEINLVKNDVGVQITLKAPYARSSQVQRKLSTLEIKVKNFLSDRINPKLLSHGGSVILIRINSSGIVFLQFLGGCNGCSMIDITLKTGIEEKLMKYFPEISGVRDITNHIPGEHSYS